MTDGEAQAGADEQNPLDDALTFFREMVEPTVAEFLEQPDDRRRAGRPADGRPALSIYFRDLDGNLLELMAADERAAE
jgi:catechol 2,3-dioxygenase-like lactoylglutathione lyase family enzyme